MIHASRVHQNPGLAVAHRVPQSVDAGAQDRLAGGGGLHRGDAPALVARRGADEEGPAQQLPLALFVHLPQDLDPGRGGTGAHQALQVLHLSGAAASGKLQAKPGVVGSDPVEGPQQQVQTLGVDVGAAEVKQVEVLPRRQLEETLVDPVVDAVYPPGPASHHFPHPPADAGRHGDDAAIGAHRELLGGPGGGADQRVLDQGVRADEMVEKEDPETAHAARNPKRGEGRKLVNPHVPFLALEAGHRGGAITQAAAGVAAAAAHPQKTQAVRFLLGFCSGISAGDQGDLVPPR